MTVVLPFVTVNIYYLPIIYVLIRSKHCHFGKACSTDRDVSYNVLIGERMSKRKNFPTPRHLVILVLVPCCTNFVRMATISFQHIRSRCKYWDIRRNVSGKTEIVCTLKGCYATVTYSGVFSLVSFERYESKVLNVLYKKYF